LKHAETIFEDVDLPVEKKDVSIQAVLCNCGSSINTKPVVGTRDACEQAAVCHCSEFVSSTSSAISLVDSGLGATLESMATSHTSSGNSHVQVSAASDEASATDMTKKAMVDVEDIDAICEEMAECDLEDTMLYDYQCNNLHPVSVNSSGADHTNVTEADGADVVHSAVKIFLHDSRQSISNTSLAVSVDDKCTSNMLESECAIATVPGPDASSDNSFIVSIDSVSLQTLPVEKGIVGHLPDSDAANDHLPSFDDTVESSKPLSAACLLTPHPNDDGAEMDRSLPNLFSDSYKMSSCDVSLDTSVNAEMNDDVFESGSGLAAARPITEVGCMVPKPTFLALESESEQGVDVCKHGIEGDLLSAEADEEIVHQSPPEICDARKILSSTAIESPVTIEDFFGCISSTSGGSEPSPKCHSGRRKSKPGKRRVSMCGEYEDESPTEFFTPYRSTVAATGHLTVIADTDEEDNSTTHKSIFYTTAVDGHLLDTVSQSDEDCTHESIQSAAEGCVPDSPIAASRPDKLSVDTSETCPSSDNNEPAEDRHTLDNQHESDMVEPGLGRRLSSSHVILHSKSVTSAASERNLKDELEDSDELQDLVPLDAADDKNRYHRCQLFRQIWLMLTFLPLSQVGELMFMPCLFVSGISKKLQVELHKIWETGRL